MYFDDLSEGYTFETASRTLPLADILGFAEQWDPQPFHTDAAAAQASPYGGIIASGFHTLLTAFVLSLEADVWNEASMGSPGMDALRWRVPVHPGDRLHCRGRVVALNPSKSRPDRGRADIAYEVINQDGTVVMTYQITHILRRRS
ncbi:MaoC family dehydratase [Pseudohalocynthiibacter aestuariivivens]|nr:MaoC family dehydratase [Pseudohalocynthiibacter aestuariivivens]QIE46451.1 MaoC family dehydratase [Pseudohalocynthiibacter aestuariivivens]